MQQWANLTKTPAVLYNKLERTGAALKSSKDIVGSPEILLSLQDFINSIGNFFQALFAVTGKLKRDLLSIN